MKRLALESISVVHALACDRCGHEAHRNDGEFEEFTSIEYVAGYSSIFGDGGRVEIDLCQKCVGECLGTWLRVTEKVEDEQIIRLSVRDQQRFAELLLNPPPLAPAMQRALKALAESECPVVYHSADAVHGEPQQGLDARRKEVLGKRVFRRQLQGVLRMLAEAAEPWPVGLRVTFEGPALIEDDKCVFVRLMQHVDDAGVARVERKGLMAELARVDDEAGWTNVLRSAGRLCGSAITLRGFGDDELLVRLVESLQEKADGLEVTLNSELVSAWRDLRPGEDEELLEALSVELRAKKRLRKLIEDGLNSGPGRAVTVEVAKELKDKALGEMADDAIAGLRQALAGQVVPDEELDRALGARAGLEDLADEAQRAADRAGASIDDAMKAVEASDMRIAAMRCRAGVLQVPLGRIKSFGPLGPQYEVGGPLRQLDDGDWLVEVTLVASGQKEEYRLSKVLEDPDAQ